MRQAVPREAVANVMKTFPIQSEVGHERSSIPWWLAELAYKEYSRRYGTEQSLERLAERGGFGHAELLAFLLPPVVDAHVTLYGHETRIRDALVRRRAFIAAADFLDTEGVKVDANAYLFARLLRESA